MLEKTIEITILFDFYSQLLTERQREMIDLYYNQDFSLGEIAETFEISRQAVYDTIKRTEKILYEYEDKLKLNQLFTSKEEAIQKALDQVAHLEDEIQQDAPKEGLKEHLEVIKSLLTDLFN
ncbi:YlxM family DNA-binding protein [Alkaliphilus transvaalensis]|uniref:YlxM family DNA-binding protein n=1 Tax=Alkaliphilus transvaalensis TaxID=114628 RepID=UPI00047B0561|nr:putative DNA-binding protein [Alkaliphilus transvaalensis]